MNIWYKGEIILLPFILESSCISGTKLCLFQLPELQKCILCFSHRVSFCKVGVVRKPTHTDKYGNHMFEYFDSRLSIGVCLLISGHQSCSWLRRAWWAESQKLQWWLLVDIFPGSWKDPTLSQRSIMRNRALFGGELWAFSEVMVLIPNTNDEQWTKPLLGKSG